MRCNFTDKTRTKIGIIQKKTGATSTAEVLRHAICLLEMALREEGSSIKIHSPSGTIREILLIT